MSMICKIHLQHAIWESSDNLGYQFHSIRFYRRTQMIIRSDYIHVFWKPKVQCCMNNWSLDWCESWHSSAQLDRRILHCLPCSGPLEASSAWVKARSHMMLRNYNHVVFHQEIPNQLGTMSGCMRSTSALVCILLRHEGDQNSIVVLLIDSGDVMTTLFLDVEDLPECDSLFIDERSSFKWLYHSIICFFPKNMLNFTDGFNLRIAKFYSLNVQLFI